MLCFIAAENKMDGLGSSYLCVRGLTLLSVKTPCLFQCPLTFQGVLSPAYVVAPSEESTGCTSYAQTVYSGIQLFQCFDLIYISSDPLAKEMVTIKCRPSMQSVWWWGSMGLLELFQ